MSLQREMHWWEGMQLSPQHLQLSQRQTRAAIQAATDGMHAFSWGVRDLVVDEGALVNSIAKVTRVSAKLADGTEVLVPENADLSQLDVKAALDAGRGEAIYVYLAVTPFRPGGRNLAARDGEASETQLRYDYDVEKIADENTGDHELDVRVLRLKARLFAAPGGRLGDDYSMPLMRLTRSGADSAPLVDPTFVPPLLELGPELMKRPVLACLRKRAEEMVGRAGAVAVNQTDQIVGKKIDFGAEDGGAFKLHVLNAFIASYEHLLGIPRLHPVTVFGALIRFAGELGIFSPARRPPPLPGYDHRDLGSCFGDLFDKIEKLLPEVHVAKAPCEKFEPWKQFLAVEIPNGWLAADRVFYVAVDSGLDANEVIKVMTHQISIGTKRSIDSLARNVIPGIPRRFEVDPPAALRRREGRLYFRLLLDLKRLEDHEITRLPSGDDDVGVIDEDLAIFDGSQKSLAFELCVCDAEGSAAFTTGGGR
ncbi:MAG: type VI secretion system baseplate subunit TssK [bacterium]|nr:type VI secretion system baseplate subunit TssK [bacterium]